jgi:hypothetical protein
MRARQASRRHRRPERIAQHHDDANADDNCDETEKELEAHAQTQPQPADAFLAELIAQVRKAQRVFIFEVLVLRIEQLRLLLQKRRGVARNFRIVPCKLRRNCGGKRFSTSQCLRRLDFRLFLLAPEDPADQTLSHRRRSSPIVSGIVADAPGIGKRITGRAKQLPNTTRIWRVGGAHHAQGSSYSLWRKRAARTRVCGLTTRPLSSAVQREFRVLFAATQEIAVDQYGGQQPGIVGLKNAMARSLLK